MKSFESITIVGISGYTSGVEILPSLLRSHQELPNTKLLLLSLEKPNQLDSSIQWKKIYPLNYFQYNLFLFHCLNRFIDTEYVLIVQDDGWIINGQAWDDEYFEYDYIGAPCHAALIDGNLHKNYTWVKHVDKNYRYIVQNGGVSLRSKKMLNLPTQIGLVFPNGNEDVIISSIYKDQLMKHGINFANTEQALHFSVEYLGPKIHDNINFKTLLAIHGQSRKLIGINLVKILYSKNRIKSIYREVELINTLKDLNFNIEYVIDT